MTPEDKWQRLNNPKTIEDYSLSMNRAELMKIPEGREIVEAMDKMRDRMSLIEEADRMANEATQSMIDKLFMEVMSGKSQSPDKPIKFRRYGRLILENDKCTT